jgi:hypothetical protein
MSSRIFENWIFTSPMYRCRFTAIHGYTTAIVLEYRVPSSWISFLRRFLEEFENSQKNRARNAWVAAFRRETPILTHVEKRLAQPQRPCKASSTKFSSNHILNIY